MMYACILIPRELSLVLTLHPNPMHVLEMSAIVWSNTHLSPGTIFYPDEGDVRLDRLENRTLLREDDIRRVYGCYDAIMNINGQEVRHCNWVRFVKTTNDPDSANVISSKVRGQSFYQVTRPIKPNEEIVVLFHLAAERSLYDRMATPPFAAFSPALGLHMSYNDLHTSLLLRNSAEENAGLITSTPVSLATPYRDVHPESILCKRRTLMFGSSSSSSSFASPGGDTPRNCKSSRNIPQESSFSSPMFSSSSRETTASDDHAGEAILDVSGEMEDENMEDLDYDEKIGAATNSDTGKWDRNDSEDETAEQKVEHFENRFQAKLDNSEEEFSHVPRTDRVDVESLNDYGSILRGTDDSKDAEDPSQRCATSKNNQLETASPNNLSVPDIHGRTEEMSATFNHPNPEQENGEDDDRNGAKKASHFDSNSDNLASSECSEDAVFRHRKKTETDNIVSSTKGIGSNFNNFPESPKSSARSLESQVLAPSEPVPVKRSRERTWWPCEICGKKFDRPSLLKRHTRTHTGEKPHACDVCGKAFSTSSSLNTHRRIHSGEKPHQCKTCGKRFTASSNLYYHRMTHNKEKPHKCDLCSKSFPTPGDLRSHMYIHNGSWPFRCDVCNRGFSKQTNLKNHMLLHSGDKPHECTRCGKKFALSCNLKTHLKTHENSDSSDCMECQQCGTVLQFPEELRDTKCKNCSLAVCHLPKSSLSSSSLASSLSSLPVQRHTDFSISKLTASDDKTVMEAAKIKTENPLPLLRPSVTCNKVKVMSPSNFLASHQAPGMYRQFISASADQHPWFVPSTNPSTLSNPCVPGSLKHSGGFLVNPLKNSDAQTHPSAMNKLAPTGTAHSLLPAFLPPEMMSLRGGAVYPSAFASLPPVFTFPTGSSPWGGHVIAQGYT